MIHRFQHRSMIRAIEGFLLLLVCMCLLSLSSTGTNAPVKGSALRAQPILFSLAAEQPDASVSVIVQKTGSGPNVEGLVARMGGAVTQDLHIINAFAAKMRAGDVLQLAGAEGVRWISLDAPIDYSGGPDGTVNMGALLTVYNQAIGADKVWSMGYQGSSVTVAVVDSGFTGHEDFRAFPSGGPMRLLTRVGFNGHETNLDDHYAHGDHVMGIIGGNGRKSKGQYVGVAPRVNLVSVKVSDGSGQSSTSGVVKGLQWIYDNKDKYNIRVVNLSLNSAVAESYQTSPLNAALEILWFNKIVVVVSAGNNAQSQSGTLYPPANDPFVITVGATDPMGTASVADDAMAGYSAHGKTTDGYNKPDILAPGSNLVGPLSSGGAELSKAHPDHRVNDTAYFRMSGTSMAAAVTAGAVALLLEKEPTLTPDQVKYRLLNTPSRTFKMDGRDVPYLNIYNAFTGKTTSTANTGFNVSRLLTTGPNGVTTATVNWGSVNWGSVNWGSVNWGSVNWGSVNWGSDYWGP